MRRFAGVVDDERVDDGHRAGERFGPAGVGQRDRLAGEPFERAVRADMDECIGAALAEPEVEGDIGVTGAAREVMILLGALLGATAFGLEGDERAAVVDHGEGEVFGRVGPGLFEVLAEIFGEMRECLAVLGKRPVNA